MDTIITVSVTAENIKNGKIEDAFNCPIALALKDISSDGSGEWCYASGSLNGTRIYAVDDEFVYEWVRDFDDGKQMQPMMFTATTNTPEYYNND